MASKRAIRRRACQGKVRHESAQAAHTARAKLIKEKAPLNRLNAYRCTFCGGWHVGHAPGLRQRLSR